MNEGLLAAMRQLLIEYGKDEFAEVANAVYDEAVGPDSASPEWQPLTDEFFAEMEADDKRYEETQAKYDAWHAKHNRTVESLEAVIEAQSWRVGFGVTSRGTCYVCAGFPLGDDPRTVEFKGASEQRAIYTQQLMQADYEIVIEEGADEDLTIFEHPDLKNRWVNRQLFGSEEAAAKAAEELRKIKQRTRTVEDITMMSSIHPSSYRRVD